MPENPLLPNASLQKLYSTMQRIRGAASGRPAGLEAILASVAQQLEPGDAVLSFAQHNALAHLLQPAKRSTPAPAVLAASSSPLAFAAGVAAGVRLAGSQRLAVVLLDTRKPEASWAGLLERAQRERMPLIVICPELAQASQGLTWAMLSRVFKKLRFPVLTVDGADAVAMYRAVQESILRARHGDGPSLLWCLLPASANSEGQSEHFPRTAPLLRLERYLAARNIPLPREKASREVTGKRGRS